MLLFHFSFFSFASGSGGGGGGGGGHALLGVILAVADFQCCSLSCSFMNLFLDSQKFDPFGSGVWNVQFNTFPIKFVFVYWSLTISCSVTNCYLRPIHINQMFDLGLCL